ncbi:MAG: hypothetical protein AAFQ40_01610 [Cyanobacteria bacterium J06623_5]
MNTIPTSDDICYALQQGKFCYVAGAQSSKVPPLSMRTLKEMEYRGYRAVLLSLRSLMPTFHAQAREPVGTHPKWECNVITAIWQQLRPTQSDILDQWLRTTELLSPRQRLAQFASDLLLLDLCEGPIVIILEGMDRQIEALGVMDALFQWIEHCFELRDTYLTYHHLSFAAFGTGNPAKGALVCVDRPAEVRLSNVAPFPLVRNPGDVDACFSQSVSSSLRMGYRMIVS